MHAKYANGSDVRDSWKQRSKLEQRLIISLTITVLLLTGFVLFVLIKHTGAPKICHTPDCLLAASQIISQIDTSVDPCHDFFKFACGKFIEDRSETSILKLEEHVERQLEKLIKEPIKDGENSWITDQKALFEACMNETAAEETSMHVFQSTLDELRGWPVVDSHRWNERLFDWKMVIYKLRDKGYSYSMMLEVAVTQDPAFNDTNRHIIRILPPDVKRIENEHKEMYKKYMTDVAVKFGAERNWASVEMGRVLDFMTNLRNVVDLYDLEEEHSYVREMNYSAALLETKFTVREYERLTGQTDWLDFINTILYPAANISVDDYVLFPKLEFIKAFYRLLQVTNKRIQANYIIWSVLEDVMEYLPKEYQEIEANYTCLVDAKTKEKNRADFCQRVIKDSYYYFEPSEIMYARKFLPKEQRDVVTEMVKNIKRELVMVLQETTWMDEETKLNAIEKASNIAEIVGAPGDYFDDALFKKYLGDNSTNDHHGIFLKMMLNRNKLQTNSMYSKMHKEVYETKFDPFYNFITAVDVMYWFSLNAMLIPVAALHGMIPSANKPMYLNYGTIGSIIGHELTHGFNEIGSKYHTDGSNSEMWTNETRQAYKEKIECIIQEAEDFEDLKVKINNTNKLQEIIADQTGFKLAYAAYKNWIRLNGKEDLLPEMTYTPHQLFWISAVSRECFEDKTGSLIKEDYNLFRIMVPLRNNPDFSKAFNCPVGSKMNPSHKCQVF